MNYIPSREQLKNSIRKHVNTSESDQNKGVPMPPIQEEKGSDTIISLPDPSKIELPSMNPYDFIHERASVRTFSDRGMSLEELSFLLYATQGVRRHSSERPLRTVPSAGNRQPFDTYLAVFKVEGLEEGIYHYLPLSHELELISQPKKLAQKVGQASNKQTFVGKGAVTFFWSVIPYRTEWRYLEGSYKVISVDAGHLCQNLYFASYAIGAGTCAICAYDQELCDELLGLDGENEFVIYLAPVGFSARE